MNEFTKTDKILFITLGISTVIFLAVLISSIKFYEINTILSFDHRTDQHYLHYIDSNGYSIQKILLDYEPIYLGDGLYYGNAPISGNKFEVRLLYIPESEFARETTLTVVSNRLVEEAIAYEIDLVSNNLRIYTNEIRGRIFFPELWKPILPVTDPEERVIEPSDLRNTTEESLA